jgi:hypothetical protein
LSVEDLLAIGPADSELMHSYNNVAQLRHFRGVRHGMP